jgi:hypothetical protein
LFLSLRSTPPKNKASAKIRLRLSLPVRRASGLTGVVPF